MQTHSKRGQELVLVLWGCINLCFLFGALLETNLKGQKKISLQPLFRLSRSAKPKSAQCFVNRVCVCENKFIQVHIFCLKQNSPQNGYSENAINLIKIVMVLLKSKKKLKIFFQQPICFVVSYLQKKARQAMYLFLLFYYSLVCIENNGMPHFKVCLIKQIFF